MKIALALVLCYLIGSIPFGVIAGYLVKGVDIRSYGSGNIGATNVMRILGPVPGLIVFILDTGKGLSAVLLSQALVGNRPYIVVAGALLAIAGHTLSVFLKFKGGKGVATSLGVILGLNPTIALVALGIWVVCVGITRYVSVASMIAAVSVPVMMFWWKGQQVPLAYLLTAVVAALLILIKHIPNVKRLIAGTENRVGQKAKQSESAADQDRSS